MHEMRQQKFSKSRKFREKLCVGVTCVSVIIMTSNFATTYNLLQLRYGSISFGVFAKIGFQNGAYTCFEGFFNFA